jgi:hypothetical protein
MKPSNLSLQQSNHFIYLSIYLSLSLYIYIHTRRRYSSPRVIDPLIHQLDPKVQSTNPPDTPLSQPTHQAAHRASPTNQRAPVHARATVRTLQYSVFFVISSAILLQCSVIFATLLSHFATVLSHFAFVIVLSHFAITFNHFSLLQCSDIFLCYNAQSF